MHKCKNLSEDNSVIPKHNKFKKVSNEGSLEHSTNIDQTISENPLTPHLVTPHQYHSLRTLFNFLGYFTGFSFRSQSI